MFFQTKKDSESVKETSGGGSYITSSGMYDVTIEAMWVEENDKGARSIGLLVDYNDQLQPIYGAFRLDNNDGSANFEQEIFNKLLVVLGIDELSDPVKADLPIGAGKSDKEMDVFEEVSEEPVTLRIAMEYGKWNNNITEKKKIRSVYRTEDKATASEIVNETEPGVQYDKDLAYADKDIIKDNLTEEDVQNWIGAGRPKNGSGSTGTGNTDKPKRKFGKK